MQYSAKTKHREAGLAASVADRLAGRCAGRPQLLFGALAQPQCSNVPPLSSDMARQGSCPAAGRHLSHRLVAGILLNPARRRAGRGWAAVWLGSSHDCFAQGRQVDEGAAAVSVDLPCSIEPLHIGAVHLQGKCRTVTATGTGAYIDNMAM